MLLAAFAALFMATGCKPDLTNDQALPLIQAHYDQAQGMPLVFKVDQVGMKAGVDAKYWTMTKKLNEMWADFKLTDEGKKLIKLPNGKDVIEWRQDPSGKFQYEMVTVAPLKLKAREVKEIRDEIIPGVKGPGKVVVYMEAHDITTLPNDLQNIILGNANNKIAVKRQADMTLENGAWAFHAIEE
jgi:hypothetical protein